MIQAYIKRSFVLICALFLYSCTSTINKTGDIMSSLVVIQENKATHSQEIIVQDIQPIKIALMVPVTGKYGDVGNGIVNAFQLALQEHGYYFVEVSVYDTGSDKAIKDIAKEVVEANTNVIVGPLFSSSLQEMAGIIPKEIPIISFSNDVRVMRSMPNVYTLSPTSLIDMERVISYVRQEANVKNIALLVPENNYGDVVEEAVNSVISHESELTLVKTIKYNPNKVNFNSDIRKLVTEHKKGGERFSKIDFDTVIIGDFSKRVFLLTSQFNLLDIDSTSINIIGTLQWDNMMKMQDSVLENAYYSSLNMRNFKPFRDKFYNLYQQEPDNLAAISYDIANMILYFVKYSEENYTYDFNLNSESLLSYESSKAVLGNFKFHRDRFAIRALNVKKVFANGTRIVVNRSENLDYIHNAKDKDDMQEQYVGSPSITKLVEDVNNTEQANQ